MNQYSLTQLRDVADNLSQLAGTFQTKPFYLRAKQIRQADKLLISTEAFFTPELMLEADQWKQTIDGLAVLKKKLIAVDNKQNEIEDLNKQIKSQQESITLWLSLDPNDKEKILQNAKRVQEFLHNKHQEKSEAHVIHRYNRFAALKQLVPYADNAQYLCEAIYHYENREKYESSILRLEEKILMAQTRLKTIQRCLWVASICCILIVTIPLCLAFCVSLWKKKRDLENQVVNGEESLRRENKRLIAAEEGSIAAQEIREILGDISLEQIRDTLTEIKDLRSEFYQTSDKALGPVAYLLSYVDESREELSRLFGSAPDEIIKCLKWFVENINKTNGAEVLLNSLRNRKNELIKQQKAITKGYPRDSLLMSIEKLDSVSHMILELPFSIENKMFFTGICCDIAPLLGDVRQTIHYASRNISVEANAWNYVKVRLQGVANMMSLCVLDVEIEQHQSGFCAVTSSIDIEENIDELKVQNL